MICEAILKIKADAEVSVSGDNIDTCVFDWLDGNPTNITRAEIKTKLTANQYQKDRAAEYPSMADQLDDIYHNGIDAWKATIKTTKDKYPKE
tara:strand:+ start:570 stop:845 length:276 start_codon:yes stop_codon:yes gene_type:complete